MNRRTISNLSREIKVSRQTIYKKIKELGVVYKSGEFSAIDYETLKKALLGISQINKAKAALPEIVIDADNDAAEELTSGYEPTLRERLKKAKNEYNYNRKLIKMFQKEADTYFAEHGKTTMVTHNGTESAIPAIASLEKYVKLNITLSKLISDLESDLDLADPDEDDIFE